MPAARTGDTATHGSNGRASSPSVPGALRYWLGPSSHHGSSQQPHRSDWQFGTRTSQNASCVQMGLGCHGVPVDFNDLAALTTEHAKAVCWLALLRLSPRHGASRAWPDCLQTLNTRSGCREGERSQFGQSTPGGGERHLFRCNTSVPTSLGPPHHHRVKSMTNRPLVPPASRRSCARHASSGE